MDINLTGQQMMNRNIAGLNSPKLNSPTTKIISLDNLYEIVNKIDRNAGVNVKSEHPTIEYRYLSSALLTKEEGPDKIVDYIKYFIQHAASQSNKNRIVINGDYERVVLTRVPNGVRVDYQRSERDYETDKDRFKRIPQSSLPNAELTRIKSKTDPRPIEAPAKDWYKRHQLAFADRVRQLKKKYNIQSKV